MKRKEKETKKKGSTTTTVIVEATLFYYKCGKANLVRLDQNSKRVTKKWYKGSA
jgi:hypothetical protein